MNVNVNTDDFDFIRVDNPYCNCLEVCTCYDVDDDTSLKEEQVPKKIVKYINGKRHIKRTCGDGYKYDPEAKRCVKLSPQELRKQKLANKKRLKKMKTKMKQILRKRMISMKIRKARGE